MTTPNHSMLNEIDTFQQKTMQSIENIKTQLTSSTELGGVTLEELRTQQKTILANMASLEEAQSKLKESKRLQRRFDRWSCLCMHATDVVPTASPSSKKEKKEKKEKEKEWKEILQRAEKQPPFSPQRRKPRVQYQSRILPAVFSTKNGFTEEELERMKKIQTMDQKIDHHIEDIDSMVDVISDLSQQLNQNIKESATQIEELHEKSESTLQQMNEVVQRSKLQLEKS